MTKSRSRKTSAKKASPKKPQARKIDAEMKAAKEKFDKVKASADEARKMSDDMQAKGEALLDEVGKAADKHLHYLGEVAWLMTRLETHKHLFMTDLEWLIIPPLSLGQARIWREKGLPVAYASWAYVDDRVAERMGKIGARISPTEWKSGKQLWLMDVITPFGGADKVVEELRKEVFKGESFKTLVPMPDGSGMKVVEMT